jgi:hypothetical protein
MLLGCCLYATWLLILAAALSFAFGYFHRYAGAFVVCDREPPITAYVIGHVAADAETYVQTPPSTKMGYAGSYFT